MAHSFFEKEYKMLIDEREVYTGAKKRTFPCIRFLTGHTCIPTRTQHIPHRKEPASWL